MQEIRNRLTVLSQRHVLSTSLRTQKLTHAHALLAQRVIALLQHLHLLIPTVRSSAIRPEEEALRTQLDATEEELVRGGAGRGKMNELWGVVGQLAALRQAGQAPGMNGGPGQEVEWRVVDPEGLETIARVRLFGVVISYYSVLIQGLRYRFYPSSSKVLRISPSYYKMIYGT